MVLIIQTLIQIFGGGYVIMLGGGIIHAHVLDAVQPFGYEVGTTLALMLSLYSTVREIVKALED